jgi:uncharacterized protein (TIGR03437 family)
MDAAHTLKKTALFLSAALVFAAPSFAQLLVNGSSTASVTLNGSSPTNVNVTTSGSTPITYTYSTSGFSAGFGVNIYPSSTTTPATLTVTASQTSCATGGSGAASCTGIITLTDTGNNADVAIITVGFTNGTGGGGGGTGTGAFTASQSSVTVAQGGSAQVTLYNNTASAVTYSIGTPTASWLQVYPASGNTNIAASSSATLNIYGLNYTSGQLNPATFTVTSGSTTLTFTVTLSGVSTSTGGLVSSLSTVNLSYPAAPTSQTVTVTNGNGNASTTYYAVATTSSGGQWLTLFPGGGVTSSTQAIGNQLLLAVNSVAAGLSTGAYYGTVTLYDGSTSQALGTISVALSVNGAGTGTTSSGVVAPAALTFGYQVGGAAPYQALLVNGTVNSATFTATGGSWTNNSVVPSYNASSNLIYVTVPAQLAAGTYTGTISVTNSSGLIQAVPVTLNVYATGTPTLLVNPNGQGDFTCSYTAGQQNCSNTSYSITASDNSNIGISAVSSVTWASVSCSSPTTPAICTIQANASSLAAGLTAGQVTVSASGTTNGSVTIPIAVFVSGSGTGTTTGALTFSSSTLNFTASASSSQSVTVTATQGGSIVYSVTSSASWLTASGSNGNVTPSTLTVTVNPAGLTAGQTYTGYLYLMAGSNTQTITVNLTVGSSTSGNVTVTNSAGTTLNSTTGLTFSGQSGAAAPAAQSINIASASGASGVTFTYSTNASWLTVNATTSGSGSAPTTLPVTVNQASLTASSTPYTGTITISPNNGTAVTIPVSFTVTPAATVSASPGTLSFSYILGSGNNPATQTITVSGNGTFSASASASGNWCQVSPTSGTAPTTLTVALTNLDNLTANQTYTCTISVTGTGQTAGSSTITASLSVTAPLPTIVKVTNAASFNTGSLSAGEIITIFGTGLGPTVGATGAASNGLFPTTLGGVQVLVGGYLAPMIYASATQVSAVVPYEINRPVFLQTVNVQVKYLSQTSNGVLLTQAAAAPGIFTANSSGSGPGAILNSNLSVNAPSNPAHIGDTVVLYVTGEGQTQPAGVSGQVTPISTSFIRPVQAPTVTINGLPAQVSFYAEAPSLIAGLLQINVVIPQGAGTGNLPVIVSFGGINSQTTATGVGAVTVAVQ